MTEFQAIVLVGLILIIGVYVERRRHSSTGSEDP